MTPTGFEPAYIAVKGLCLQPLDDGAMYATYFWLGSCQTYTLSSDAFLITFSLYIYYTIIFLKNQMMCINQPNIHSLNHA